MTFSEGARMLRTFLILGLVVVVGGALIGALLGIATLVLLFLLKIAIVGAVVYLALRIISPKTAAQLRDRIEQMTLPKW
jgi:ABC-type lipoprotein release transport system permease subunit